jgi:hypothetical protein
VTAAVREAAPVLDCVDAASATYSPRPTPATWPQTEQSREAAFSRLTAPPLRASTSEYGLAPGVA